MGRPDRRCRGDASGPDEAVHLVDAAMLTLDLPPG
jgi:hypothetical protein